MTLYLTLKIRLLRALIDATRATHNAVMDWASTAYILAIARRNAQASRPADGHRAIDTLIGAIGIIGMVAALTVIAMDHLGDLHALYLATR